jgi:hypothetical protein
LDERKSQRQVHYLFLGVVDWVDPAETDLVLRVGSFTGTGMKLKVNVSGTDQPLESRLRNGRYKLVVVVGHVCASAPFRTRALQAFFAILFSDGLAYFV